MYVCTFEAMFSSIFSARYFFIQSSLRTWVHMMNHLRLYGAASDLSVLSRSLAMWKYAAPDTTEKNNSLTHSLRRVR